MVFVVLVPIDHEEVRGSLSNQNGWKLQLKSTTHHLTSVHNQTRKCVWVGGCLWAVVTNVDRLTSAPLMSKSPYFIPCRVYNEITV